MQEPFRLIGDDVGRIIRRAGEVALCLGALAAAPIAWAEVVVLQPGRDNTLIESATGAPSNGSGPHFFAGRTGASSGSIRRAVIAFDIAGSVPPGSVITGAALTVRLSQTNAGPVEVSLHTIRTDWGEGASSATGGGGAPAAAGDATWIHTFYPETLWTAPGADFDPIPRVAAIVDQPGFYTWGPTPGMVADVQAWLEATPRNPGWLLKGDERFPTTVKKFDSRENPDANGRPVLWVEFTPPCRPDPVGPGYWNRPCLDPGEGAPAEPGFVEVVVPCAERMLQELGFPLLRACDGILADPPGDCREKSLRKLTSLLLNVCSWRLQTSCPVDRAREGCTSRTVGDLLGEVGRLILDGECRRASSCAGAGE